MARVRGGQAEAIDTGLKDPWVYFDYRQTEWVALGPAAAQTAGKETQISDG